MLSPPTLGLEHCVLERAAMNNGTYSRSARVLSSHSCSGPGQLGAYSMPWIFCILQQKPVVASGHLWSIFSISNIHLSKPHWNTMRYWWWSKINRKNNRKKLPLARQKQKQEALPSLQSVHVAWEQGWRPKAARLRLSSVPVLGGNVLRSWLATDIWKMNELCLPGAWEQHLARNSWHVMSLQAVLLFPILPDLLIVSGE